METPARKLAEELRQVKAEGGNPFDPYYKKDDGEFYAVSGGVEVKVGHPQSTVLRLLDRMSDGGAGDV